MRLVPHNEGWGAGRSEQEKQSLQVPSLCVPHMTPLSSSLSSFLSFTRTQGPPAFLRGGILLLDESTCVSFDLGLSSPQFFTC